MKHIHLFKTVQERNDYLKLNSSGQIGTGTSYFNEPVLGFTLEDSGGTLNKVPSLRIENDGHEYSIYDKDNLTREDVVALLTNNGLTISSPFNAYVGFNVKSLGEGCFSGMTGLQNIRLGIGITVDWQIGVAEFTSIPSKCFAKSGLQRIVLPNNITSIGGEAFSGCTSLVEVVMPKRNISLNDGNKHFYGCTNLTSITSESLTNIPSYAFCNCNSLSEFTFNNKMGYTIDEYAFSGCTGLTNIIITDNITSIGNYAFAGCKLNEVTLGSGLTTNGVGYGAFTGFTGIYNLRCQKVLNRDNAMSYVNSAYFGNYKVVNLDSNITSLSKECFYKVSTLCAVTMTNNITSFGNGCFSNCIGLKTVDCEDTYSFSTGLTTIPTSCFSNCEKLTNIKMPNTIQTVQSYAFRDCKILTSCTFSNTLTSVALSGFSNCNLYDITFPNTLLTIGVGAFSYNISLTACTFNENLTTIENHAFYATEIRDIVLPSTITSIGKFAFSKSETFSSTRSSYRFTLNSSGVTNIGEGVLAYNPLLSSITINQNSSKYISDNYNAIINTTSSGVVAGCKTTKLPNYITKLNNYSFAGADITNFYEWGDTNHPNDLQLPNTLQTIGTFAFHYTKKLNYGYIPNSVTIIGNGETANTTVGYSFSESTVKTLHYSSGLTYIGPNSFLSAGTLEAVNLPNTVTFIGDGSFWCCSALTAMTVATGGTTTYNDKGGKNIIVNNNDVLEYGCKNSDLYGELYVTKIKYNAFCYQPIEGVLTIPWTVTEIEYSAFYNCSKLTEVDAGGSFVEINKIGASVWQYCTGLTSVTISTQYLTEIGVRCFSGCNSLQRFELTIDYGQNSITIGTECFHNCTGLTEVNLQPVVTTIGISCFKGCNSLQNINLYNIDEIPNTCFSGCSNLTSVTTNATIYGESCFIYCYSLQSHTIKASMLPAKMFYACSSLTSVTLEIPVESIGNNCFYNCKNLSALTIPITSATTLGSGLFGLQFGIKYIEFSGDASWNPPTAQNVESQTTSNTFYSLWSNSSTGKTVKCPDITKYKNAYDKPYGLPSSKWTYTT